MKSQPSLAQRLLGGPWLVAAMVSIPLAHLYVIVNAINADTQGDWGLLLFYLLFGWIVAMLAALIIVIPPVPYLYGTDRR